MKTESPSLSAFHWVHILLALFFIFSVYVNLNDPDPMLWLCIYGFASLLNLVTFATVRGWWKFSLPIAVPVIYGFLCTIGMSKLLLEVQEKYGILEPAHIIERAGSVTWEFFETEEGREIGGLAILALDMLLIAYTLRQNRKKGTSTSVMGNLVYFITLSVVGVAFYAAIFLQPEMNKRLQVPHCNGQLEL